MAAKRATYSRRASAPSARSPGMSDAGDDFAASAPRLRVELVQEERLTPSSRLRLVEVARERRGRVRGHRPEQVRALDLRARLAAEPREAAERAVVPRPLLEVHPLHLLARPARVVDEVGERAVERRDSLDAGIVQRERREERRARLVGFASDALRERGLRRLHRHRRHVRVRIERARAIDRVAHRLERERGAGRLAHLRSGRGRRAPRDGGDDDRHRRARVGHGRAARGGGEHERDRHRRETHARERSNVRASDQAAARAPHASSSARQPSSVSQPLSSRRSWAAPCKPCR